jgi:hypothetical protein
MTGAADVKEELVTATTVPEWIIELVRSDIGW